MIGSQSTTPHLVSFALILLLCNSGWSWRVTALRGRADILPEGASHWRPLVPAEPLAHNTRLRTYARTWLQLGNDAARSVTSAEFIGQGAALLSMPEGHPRDLLITEWEGALTLRQRDSAGNVAINCGGHRLLLQGVALQASCVRETGEFWVESREGNARVFVSGGQSIELEPYRPWRVFPGPGGAWVQERPEPAAVQQQFRRHLGALEESEPAQILFNGFRDTTGGLGRWQLGAILHKAIVATSVVIAEPDSQNLASAEWELEGEVRHFEVISLPPHRRMRVEVELRWSNRFISLQQGEWTFSQDWTVTDLAGVDLLTRLPWDTRNARMRSLLAPVLSAVDSLTRTVLLDPFARSGIRMGQQTPGTQGGN